MIAEAKASGGVRAVVRAAPEIVRSIVKNPPRPFRSIITRKSKDQA